MFIAHALLFFLLLFNLLYAHTAASGWLRRNTFKRKHIKTLKKKINICRFRFCISSFALQSAKHRIRRTNILYSIFKIEGKYYVCTTPVVAITNVQLLLYAYFFTSYFYTRILQIATARLSLKTFSGVFYRRRAVLLSSSLFSLFVVKTKKKLRTNSKFSTR